MTDNASGPEWRDANSGPNFQRNDTAETPNPQDIVPSVRSGAGAWNRTPTSRQAEWCMRFKLRLGKGTTGEFSSIRMPCLSWTHQSCAEKRAEEAIVAFQHHWFGAVLYFVSVPTHPSILDRIRQRRRGKAVRWVAVSRSDDTTHLYSSVALAGRKAPKSWVELTQEAAVHLFAGQSMALPGVDRVRSMPSWQITTVDTSGINVSFGHVPDRIWDAATEAAAERIGAEFEVQFEPGEPLPAEVPVQVWFDAIAEEIDRIRETHAHPIGQQEPHDYPYS